MCVTISVQGSGILRACEDKARLQVRAEAITVEARALLEQLRTLSNEQHALLQNMAELDLKIEYLTRSVLSKT